MRTKPFLYPFSTVFTYLPLCTITTRPQWPRSDTRIQCLYRNRATLFTHTQLVSKCVRDWRVSWRCWAVLPAGPGRGSAASCSPPSPKQYRRCQAQGATDFGPHPRWGIQSWQESGRRLSRRFTTSLQLTFLQKRWGCDILPVRSSEIVLPLLLQRGRKLALAW